jgi:hypothetical protein
VKEAAQAEAFPLTVRRLQQALERLTAAGIVEVHEAGESYPALSGFQFSVSDRCNRISLQLWTAESNVTRQVIGMEDAKGGGLTLKVMRFGRTRPSRLEFTLRDSPQAPVRLTREKFRGRFRQVLRDQFPDDAVEMLTAAPDLEHSFSGNYLRGVMARGAGVWALLAASPTETPATIEAALSFALIWLEAVRQRPARRTVAGLRLFLPADCAAMTAFRLQAVHSPLPVELYEYEAAMREVRRVSVSDSGNIATRLTPRGEVERTLQAAKADLARIVALAPQIDQVVPPGSREVALRFRGLEFARWSAGRVLFGLTETRRELISGQWPALIRLVRRLEKGRDAQRGNSRDPLFRAQAERWLETLLLADPARIDARLDPHFLYSQVPAFSSGDRGVLDLLGVTREGRLAVIEIKASEDIHLPLQAADYWVRVWTHQRQGDFQRFGYFPGIELQAKPPLLFLVAPGFQFHPSSEIILRYLAPEIEVCRIGLNEGWRAGVQVIFRM